jgi:signal transduction histidine kinase
MADQLPLTGRRVSDLLQVLEMMAAGDLEKRLVISEQHDELDAIAHGINVLVGELGWTTARVVEAQEERAAAAERASNAKNIFLRNMSHEIRTPIAAMLGIAELLASPVSKTEDRGELLRRLQANGQAVMSLLDDLLDLARLDAHKILFTPEAVSVIEVVRDVLASLEVDSRAKQLAIRVDVSDEALGSIRTDKFRLRQILMNLLSNAIKFTESGGITVSLRASNASTEAAEWIIDIADTGVGIAADEQAHVFELFEQANPSISRTYGGNGLGLAISRKLAEQLSGSLILLNSVPGEGTTFRLTMRPLTAPPPAVRNGSAETEKQVSIAGVRILLAEDHRDMHFTLRASLEGAGATVESARDGREAVDRAMSAAFDVVLMDLRMPNMDGLQATRQLRRNGNAVPIIALTADPATLRRAEALDAGCDACLSKPFKVADLIASIRLSTRAAG